MENTEQDVPPPLAKSLRDATTRDLDELTRRVSGPLRIAARRAIRVWFNQGRLDGVLTDFMADVGDCELVYAIDANGKQASSNVMARSIDLSAYGQDLSRRPFAVHFAALGNPALCGAFFCHAYTSKVTRHACVTVMRGVMSGDELLGFIAADFDPDQFGR